MKEFIGKTKMKQWFIKEIKPFVKQYKFTVGPRYGIQIIFQEDEEMLYYTSITVGWSDHLSFGGAFIRCKKVEKILFQITGLGVYENTHTITAASVGKTALIEKHQDIIDLTNYFKDVFPNEILPAFERYSDPKNVLEFWDSLNDEGKLKHFFDPYNRVKIMILSKMCNDESYERRCQEAIDFYTMHYNNGIESAKGLIDDCYKIIKYLEENEI